MSMERAVCEVDFVKTPPGGPLGTIKEAGIHPHGLPAQVRLPMGLVVVEHPDQHLVHVHSTHDLFTINPKYTQL